MERLTSYKSECKREMICKYEDCNTCEEHCPHLNEDNCPCLQEVLEKLAEYEDTGLTPEQIKDIDRLYTEKCKELGKERQKHICEPEYLGENTAIGCRSGMCECKNIVRSYQNFCDQCGIKLDW